MASENDQFSLYYGVGKYDDYCLTFSNLLSVIKTAVPMSISEKSCSHLLFRMPQIGHFSPEKPKSI